MPAAIVGRESELAAVCAFLDASTGRPSALVIEGEAGMGKTTIVHAALERAASSGLRVFLARPGSGETELPYAGLGDLLAGVERSVLETLARPQRDAMEAALGRAGSSATADVYALSRGVLEVLGREAAENGLLLVVDDVQWLDRPTVSTLGFALRRLASVRLRVLVARRIGDGLAPALPLGLDDWEDVRRVAVGPMPTTELGALIRQRLSAQLPRPQLEGLWRESGGNPMFALELARRGYGHNPQPASAPRTLPQALEERLRALDDAPRSALAFAAAALRPSPELLLSAGVERAELRSALATGLIAQAGDRLAFAHPLLRTAAYGLLLPDERRRVHAQLAVASQDAVEQGHHVSRSAAGRDESAAQALDRAAWQASSRGDHAGAAAFLLRAANLSTDPEGQRAHMREADAAEQLLFAGDVRAATNLACSLLERVAAGPLRARVRMTHANCVVGGEMSYEEMLAELTLALADAEGDNATSAAVHQELAELAAAMFRLEQSLEHSRAAMAWAERAGDTAIQRTSLGMIGFVEFLLGRGVNEAATGASTEWDGTTFSVSGYSPRMAFAEVCLYSAEFAQAERLYREELAMAEQRGLEATEVIARAHLAETQVRSGDWAAALPNARLAVEHARQAADDQIVTGTAYVLGMIEALLGELDAAHARASRALGVAEAAGDFWHTLFNRSVLGLVALTSGDPKAAVGVLEPAWSAIVASELGDLSVFPVAHVLGEALAAVDRRNDALAVANALRACPAGDRPWCRSMAARIEALVASARGEHTAAREAVAAALAAHVELPEPFEHARTIQILGRVERRARNWGAARGALVEALERFDELGAARWAEKAAAEIAGLPGRRPADSRTLTAREREVAELVVAGLSNKEIAARLFVSLRTVEANLSKVYAKLGIHSRGALGHALADDARR